MKRISLIIIFLSTIYFETSAQGEFVAVTQITADAIQYQKIEFDIELAVSFSNPYRQEEIALDVLVESPSGLQIVVPCFYKFGGSVESHWGARFAAKESGEYQYHFELTKASSLSASTEVEIINVKATASDGFLSSVNSWSMVHDSGKPLRGIGENIAWEGRSWESEQYTYEYFLSKLKANGGNYFRTWMGPWNLPLEWTRVVDTERYNNENGFYHTQGIQRMDELVELCDSLELYFMLAFEWHGALQTDGRWNINPYNATNGGPASTPTEFFTSEEAKSRYKNKLRYVVARWGYSPAIAAWEFFNEVDNAVYNGTESNIAIPHDAVTKWHKEMGGYLKQIDPYNHLVTTSVSHREINGLFNLSELDFVQKHYYRTTGNLPEAINDNRSKFSKPFVVGEFGFDWDWNNIHEANRENLEYDYKRGLWYGLFSPTPILPLSWWWEFFDTHQTDKYVSSVRHVADRISAKAPAGNYQEVAVSSTVLSLDAFALKAGDTYFIYILNNSSTPTSNKSVQVSIAENVNFSVTAFDPETSEETNTGTVAPASGSVELAGLSFRARESKILMLSPEGSSTGLQRPFENAIQLPGVIEAEHYDIGGEDVSFNDLDDVNSGNVLRDDGVDVASEGESIFVTDLAHGEWLEYTVDLQQAGIYEFSFSIRNKTAADKSFQVYWDGLPMGEVLFSDELNTWSEYQFTSPLLHDGQHILKIGFTAHEVDFDKVQVELINFAPVVTLDVSPLDQYLSSEPITLSATASDEDGGITKVGFIINDVLVSEDDVAPYEYEFIPTTGSYKLIASATDDKGITASSEIVSITVSSNQQQFPYPNADLPHVVPGKIEAEHFDEGEAGVAFHDRTPGNIKTNERSDSDVDLEVCTDIGGGYNLADIQADEWVEYTMNVTSGGYYKISFRVATEMTGQSFEVLVNDTTVINEVKVPNTGAWQTWRDVETTPFKMSSGVKVLRLSFKSEFFNLNYFTISETDPITGTLDGERTEPLFPNPSNTNFKIKINVPARYVSIYSLEGKLIHHREEISPGIYETPDLPRGVYLISITAQSGNKKYLKGIIK